MGRWIVITGCSSGIGRYCAEHLHARGWNVIATARDKGGVMQLKADGYHAIQLDYADAQSIKRAARNVATLTGGKLYALLNNGAYAQQGALEDIPGHVMRAQFEANFLGWHDLTHRLLPLIRANGEGRIVQMSSFLGLVALRWRGAYVASKFALEGLSDTLRMELRDSRIHVALIEPGPIDGEFPDTAAMHFYNTVDLENSNYREAYAPLLKRLEKGHTSMLTLGIDAVYVKILHALESDRPKARYPVTLATPMFSLLKRLLPQRLLDRFLHWASDQ